MCRCFYYVQVLFCAHNSIHSSTVSFVEMSDQGLSSLGGSKGIKLYGNQLFGTLKSVLCRAQGLLHSVPITIGGFTVATINLEFIPEITTLCTVTRSYIPCSFNAQLFFDKIKYYLGKDFILFDPQFTDRHHFNEGTWVSGSSKCHHLLCLHTHTDVLYVHVWYSDVYICGRSVHMKIEKVSYFSAGNPKISLMYWTLTCIGLPIDCWNSLVASSRKPSGIEELGTLVTIFSDGIFAWARASAV